MALLTAPNFVGDARAQSCDVASCPAVRVYGEGEAAACRAWATLAVGQHLENEQRSCGYTGDDWHYDIKLHYKICGGLSQLDREQFSETRRNQLDECTTSPKSSGDDGSEVSPKTGEQKSGKTPEWDEYCRKSYLVDALKVARDARDWKCTDVDPEFHLSRQRHYDFCIKEAPKGAGDYPLHDVIGDRQEKIKTCRRKAAVKKPIDRKTNVRRRACSKFADIFLNATLENKRLKCGNDGDGWHTKWNSYYRACSELKRSERLQLINDRQSVLRDCRKKVFPKAQIEADNKDGKSSNDVSEVLREACTTYAKDAAAHQAANDQLSCGFSGPLWDLKESKHFDECTTRRADYSFQSNLSRDAKLRQCTSARLCEDPSRAKTLFCQDLTGLVPPKAN